jgi:flagellar protein FlgJ
MDISGLTSAYTDTFSSLADSQAAKQLQNKLAAGATPSASEEELMDVCKQFESYFLEQVYKAMWKTVPQTEYSSNATATLMELQQEQMIQTMAETSTEQNGLGLAQTLFEQMRHNYGLPDTKTDTEPIAGTDS